MRSHNDCKTNLDENLEKYILNGYFNISEIEKGKNEIIKCQDTIITLTTTKNQKNNNNKSNKTIVDLSKCEEVLREKYQMFENQTIFMKKIDVWNEGMKTPKIVYNVYKRVDETNLTRLD